MSTPVLLPNFVGSDTACIIDIGLTDTVVSDPIAVIAQRIARRLQTPRGGLSYINDDPDFGYDVRQLINAKYSPGAIAAAQGTIEGEIEKDEQVARAGVLITIGAAGLVTISAQITSSAGPFSLTMSVTALTVSAVFAFQAAP